MNNLDHEKNKPNGFVLFHDSKGDGENDEMLIMDDPDITKAVKVWRISEKGMEFSENGYAGPFIKPDLSKLLGEDII